MQAKRGASKARLQELYLKERREEFSARVTSKIAYSGGFSPTARASDIDTRRGKLETLFSGERAGAEGVCG